jgi:glycosyltransferase involved in cell wall biosynthesis
MRILLCGTHPIQYNGYSKVVYNLAKNLCEIDGVKLTIFGFQHFQNEAKDAYQGIDQERSLPYDVVIYDAWKHESPKARGFGENEIVEFVRISDPDVIIIYNDLVVTNMLVEKLRTIPNPRFQIIPYLDVVYEYETKTFYDNLFNNHEDIHTCFAFTRFWKTEIERNLKRPVNIHVLNHGFNNDTFYPIDKPLARKFFDIGRDEFIIVNLNRNQPRKRWDLTIVAYARFISMHLEDPIKLFISASVTGSWNLVDVYLTECSRLGISVDDAKKHIIVSNVAQKMTDYDINLLYNVADVGINTCDGEGFGLCNFEQGLIGIPQIVPNIGGFKEFMSPNTGILVPTSQEYYLATTSNSTGGIARVADVREYVTALEYYYSNRDAMHKHGENMRAKKDMYAWKPIAEYMHTVIADSFKEHILQAKSKEESLINLSKQLDNQLIVPANESNVESFFTQKTIVKEDKIKILSNTCVKEDIDVSANPIKQSKKVKILGDDPKPKSTVQEPVKVSTANANAIHEKKDLKTINELKAQFERLNFGRK